MLTKVEDNIGNIGFNANQTLAAYLDSTRRSTTCMFPYSYIVIESLETKTIKSNLPKNQKQITHYFLLKHIFIIFPPLHMIIKY